MMEAVEAGAKDGLVVEMIDKAQSRIDIPPF
jgi:hypothetical protein